MLKLCILLVTFWTIYAKANLLTEDYQRPLDEGEKVIHNLTAHQVVTKDEENNYIIKSLDSFNWIFTAAREELAVTSGCAHDVCVKDKMFDTGYQRYVSVEGITYNGEYIVETNVGWDGYYKPFKNNMARISGCHPDQNKKICVGDQVKNQMGKIMAVIAFQPDWKLVLKSTDGWETFQTNVAAQTVTLLPAN